MKKVTTYGERCSGTDYLRELLLLNFDVEISWCYGWKHFFGFSDLSNSDDTLFIGIIRNLEDWINSLYRNPHHLPLHLIKTFDTFLNDTFYSVLDDKNPFYSVLDGENEIMNDRNIDTGERYKNIFELRLVKNKYLIEKMPKLVKNYCLITYDNLLDSFEDTMNKLKDCGLKKKDNILFPLNIPYIIQQKNVLYKKKNNIFPEGKITAIENENEELKFYENLLFPKKNALKTPEK